MFNENGQVLQVVCDVLQFTPTQSRRPYHNNHSSLAMTQNTRQKEQTCFDTTTTRLTATPFHFLPMCAREPLSYLLAHLT
jgi:hypothetical protein